MTLIVGIICKDGIVMAGDSQTTWGSGKRWDANKMTEVGFPYGRALVAESGATLTSARITEELIKVADNRKLFDEHGMGGLAEIAVRKVRDKLRSQNFDCTSEELQDVIERNELESALMIAHHSVEEGRIDTISLSTGISEKAKTMFETIGCGADLATYILTDLCTPDLDSSFGSVIAVHVVESVKRHDPYCGGPTRLGILKFHHAGRLLLQPPSVEGISRLVPPDFDFPYYVPPLIVSQTETEELVKIVSEVQEAVRHERAKIIRDALHAQSERQRKELDEAMDKLYLDSESADDSKKSA